MTKLKSFQLALQRWVDSSAGERDGPGEREGVDWFRTLPFLSLHLACLGVFWVGWSLTAVLIAGILYLIRMFAITGFYHRYFSHRTYQTSRLIQFLFALAGTTAVQRGPLWWAAHHREHHYHADQEGDPHSPHREGFLWSHMGWFTTQQNFHTRLQAVPDLARYPELRFLDRFDIVGPVLLLTLVLGVGFLMEKYASGLGTSAGQLFVWGFCISTVVLFHATSAINSLAHKMGSRRYATSDESRNSLLLALLTLGEGWHNNHHHYPAATRQGFYWWEVDLTYYGLWILSRLGVIWQLRGVPARVKKVARL